MFRNQSSQNLKIIIKMSITKWPSISRFRAIKHALVASFKNGKIMALKERITDRFEP